MIEITFTESACGSLKMAQIFGKGEYHGGSVGVFFSHSDGSEPTQQEMEEAQKEAEEQQRRAWEQAVPMGGRASDVYGFPLGLSFGDIRDPMGVEARLDALKILYSFWTMDLERELRRQFTALPGDLEKVIRRIAEGEPARVWYSDSPEELCGFYWMMDQLRGLPKNHGIIYGVKQPKFEESEGSIRSFSGWGEIEPGQFHQYAALALPISDQQCRFYSNVWRDLQQENALIRACINGILRSAPEDLYDVYIRMEIDAQPEEFREAVVVGNVLGKYQPGIGDGYIHYRIDKLVQSRELTVVTSPREGDPGYWRILRKA